MARVEFCSAHSGVRLKEAELHGLELLAEGGGRVRRHPRAPRSVRLLRR
jgi:hypothetical protein